mgnify:CR=1 FL=1
MNSLILLSLLLSVVLGIARGADLLFGTDMATGLCTVGSVWWRYAALAVVVLAAVLAGYKAGGRSPEAVRRRSPAAGLLSFGVATAYVAAAAAQLLAGASGIGAVIRAVLQMLCVFWLALLGRSWLRPEDGRGPLGNLVLAVCGSLLFYWNVLMRFMENSSSWHRVTPTAAVWQALAALVFLANLARALYVPGADNGRELRASGLAAFCLCLCWELPRMLVLMTGLGFAAPAVWAAVFACAALCCIGGLGGVCAVACADRAR